MMRGVAEKRIMTTAFLWWKLLKPQAYINIDFKEDLFHLSFRCFVSHFFRPTFWGRKQKRKERISFQRNLNSHVLFLGKPCLIATAALSIGSQKQTTSKTRIKLYSLHSLFPHIVLFTAFFNVIKYTSSIDSNIILKFIMIIMIIIITITIIIIIYSFESFSYQRSLMVSRWSDSKSPQDSRTLLSILVNPNNAVLCMVFTCPLISKSSSSFANPLRVVPNAPITYRCF